MTRSVLHVWSDYTYKLAMLDTEQMHVEGYIFAHPTDILI